MLFVNVTRVTLFINCKTKNSYINKYYPHNLAPKIWEPPDQGLFFQQGAKKRERGYVLLTQALQHSLTIKIVCSRKDTPPSTAEINNTPSPFLDMLYKFKTFINTPPPPLTGRWKFPPLMGYGCFLERPNFLPWYLFEEIIIISWTCLLASSIVCLKKLDFHNCGKGYN